ncbi:hypothetical protein Trydic_g3557 [Trypoxylus dichotomus]
MSTGRLRQEEYKKYRSEINSKTSTYAEGGTGKVSYTNASTPSKFNGLIVHVKRIGERLTNVYRELNCYDF